MLQLFLIHAFWNSLTSTEEEKKITDRQTLLFLIGSCKGKPKIYLGMALYNIYSDMIITDGFENLHIRVLTLILIINFFFSC